MGASHTLTFPTTGNSLVANLRQLIKTYRRGGWLTIHRAAQLAGISVRTLQRRLTEEGWVFSELVDQVRVEMATEMLRESEVPLSDIAMHLGYSNQANFTRAFQRWTGETPARFRNWHTDEEFASPYFRGLAETEVIKRHCQPIGLCEPAKFLQGVPTLDRDEA